ncbi:hypothetical protein [Stenotrophomonas sp. 24(2023)]|uniref:hypothetical protein n=1 Tax=Stenotrophomonas sp. 24(2023) TaxID=3068324 RepID=UPI0027DEC43A|nr:hypothetical protein [Stenotrophomonas sp. 24(2023)]WMJ68132.1 hypothetical protein Q9R17_13085 [Stenotrophomonas sp. 24(2023)]
MNTPPPLPRQSLAELQLASHLYTLKILFYALSAFHGVAAVCFLGFGALVLVGRAGGGSATVLAVVYATTALIAALLCLLQLRTARLLGQRSQLAWCQRAAWLAVLAGPLGIALTGYAVYLLRKPEVAAQFDQGAHLSA